MSVVSRLDRFQRNRSWLGFPIAVFYKFYDDRGAYLAALVTYYAFVSLFPLLLLFVSILGYFAAGNASLRHTLVTSALANFPVVGTQIRQNIAGLTGNATALAVGIGGVLYGGIGVTQAAQTAFNRIYAVPRNSQPNPVKSRLRSLLILLVLGTSVLLASGLAMLVSTANTMGSNFGLAARVGAGVLAVAIDIGIFTAAYKLLVAQPLQTRQVLLGGVLSGVAWWALQSWGSAYLSSRLAHSRELYGTFGLVLGTLGWLYLEALVVMLCAEINVTLDKRLWPRALMTPFTDNVSLTEADERAYAAYACTQRFKGFERIDVTFAREEPFPAVRPTRREPAVPPATEPPTRSAAR